MLRGHVCMVFDVSVRFIFYTVIVFGCVLFLVLGIVDSVVFDDVAAGV